MSLPLEETPFFGLVGAGWLAGVVDDVLGVSEEDEGGIVVCFFVVFVFVVGCGLLQNFLSIKDVSHISSSTEDSILDVMSGTVVMYSGIII